MLKEGCTLKQINDECKIWNSVPEHLENVNKDNCFKISYWQCCDKPAYQIVQIYFDGKVNVHISLISNTVHCKRNQQL